MVLCKLKHIIVFWGHLLLSETSESSNVANVFGKLVLCLRGQETAVVFIKKHQQDLQHFMVP